MTTSTLTLDLVPYDLEIDGDRALLKHAPVNIEVPRQFRSDYSWRQEQWRFEGLFVDDEFFELNQFGEHWLIRRRAGPITAEHVVRLIDQNYDAIHDLQWEALRP